MGDVSSLYRVAVGLAAWQPRQLDAELAGTPQQFTGEESGGPALGPPAAPRGEAASALASAAARTPATGLSLSPAPT